jgi:hypothetical protein
MPGYGVPEDTADLLPWSWAVELLGRVPNMVLGTVRSDGRPHAMPVWAVWVDGLLCFSTAITSIKSRNLQENPRCTVTAERGDDALVLEGVAELSDLPDGFTDVYRAKYGQTIDRGPIWVVRPTAAFAFRATAEDFSRTATRWQF